MEPTIDELRTTYKRFSDDKLIKIATTRASDLRPEAIQVVQEEIKSRGLSTDLLGGIQAQRKEITPIELNEYITLLQKQPCPLCGSTSSRLNATMVGSVRSFVVFTSWENKLVIACPDCLRKANKTAMIKTALFGWWGIPWGVFRTIQALMLNYEMMGKSSLTDANEYLEAFVIDKVGKIEAYKSDQKGLQSLLKRPN